MATAISKVIDEILTDIGEPLDGTGHWTRVMVLEVLNYIQRQISRITENILTKTSTIEPASGAREITIDSNGNLLRVRSAVRLETSEWPINVWTKDQIADYDPQWYTRTGNLVEALITDTADAGKALIYPELDNANNDLIVWFIKLADNITAELTEAGDASNQLSNWIINGITSSNSNSFVLYWKLTNAVSTRTVNIYKDSAGTNEVASGSVSGDGTITLTASNDSGINDSGISGSVTVAYSGDDTTVSANTLTFTQLEIPDVDLMALKFGGKWMLYKMEVDAKNEAKANYYLGLYGYDAGKEAMHSGALREIIDRLKKIRSPEG
jgi:hypothetical protein